MRKRIIICIVTVFILFLLIGFDSRLEVTNYTYQSSEIPSDFDNFKICHISDLHCENFGKNNQTLLQAIQKMSPDIVVLTGDIVDEDHDDLSSVENLFSGLKNLEIPAYYVTGNHELQEDAAVQYSQLLRLMYTYDVSNLDDNSVYITRGDSSIELTGCKWYSKYLTHFLQPADSEGFHVLLYHGADFYDLISDYNYDLVLTGHIHGGIVQIPILDIGVIGNIGNLFPKYTHGIYQSENQTSTMIVSRGLGDAVIPRFYNRPELICITLQSNQLLSAFPAPELRQ